MNSKIDIRIALVLGFLPWAFTARAQAPVKDAGQVPPHVIKISSGYFGQMLGIKDYGDGDSLFGLVPLYLLDSSTLKLGTDTVITTGNVSSYADTSSTNELINSVTFSGGVYTIEDAGASWSTDFKSYFYSAVATSGSYKGLTEVDNTTVGLDLSILGTPLTITGTDRFAAWDPEGNGNVVVLWSDMVSALRDSIDVLSSSSLTTGYVTYFDGSGLANSSLYYSFGNLGINTTSPDAFLSLRNSNTPVRTTVVTTQTFDTSNDWSTGTGWSITGGVANATSATGDLTYTGSLTIISGNAYEVTFTVSGYTSGTLNVYVGNAYNAVPSYNGTYTVLIIPTSSNGGFRFTTSAFTGKIDNVSVVEISNKASKLLSLSSSTTSLPITVTGNSLLWSDSPFITGTDNIVVGTKSGASLTTGYSNIFIGHSSGAYNTTGFHNVYIGNYSGASNISGLYNVFIGNNAGRNSIGNENTFIGYNTGLYNTTGHSNTLIGHEAGLSNSTGNYNIMLGVGAGELNTTGNHNTNIGFEAGYANSSGNFNILLGTWALKNNQSGGNNIAIGFEAGAYTSSSSQVTSSNNSIYIGKNTKASSTSTNYETVIGVGNVGKGNYTTTIGHASGYLYSNSKIACAQLGVASTPAYTWEGDENTGLFSPAADNLAISTAGTERLRVDASGNVGIGTSPSVKFHVSGQSRIDGTFSVKGSGSTPFSTGSAAEMRWWNTSGGQWSSIVTDAGDWQIYNPSNKKLMSISNAGKHYVYVQDNTVQGYVLSGLDGNTYIQLVTTDGAENLRLGYPVSTSWITLNAGIQVKYDGSHSSSFTVAPGDYILDVNATSAPVTVTLPATPNIGEVHIIIKQDSSANAVTINGNGYNINGSASVTLASQYDRKTIVFTGAAWRIID